MSDILNQKDTKTLFLSDESDHGLILKLSRALSNPDRVKILHLLLNRAMPLSEIQDELSMPLTSIARHCDILAEAGLIFIAYEPGLKGHTKYCSQATQGYAVSLKKNAAAKQSKSEHSVEMPIGMFSHCRINPPCGMLGPQSEIIPYDTPNAFFSPQRKDAECLWFDKGFVSYDFPACPKTFHDCREITFSFEICSETMYYNNKWPSDITLCINETEIITFTSPGDFGGRRGKYTPEYWPVTSTQYGLLKTLKVNGTGVYLDNILQNTKIRFEDLNIKNNETIKFKIGIKEDAVHQGGINLFGKNFGDFPQAIKMIIK